MAMLTTPKGFPYPSATGEPVDTAVHLRLLAEACDRMQPILYTGSLLTGAPALTINQDTVLSQITVPSPGVGQKYGVTMNGSIYGRSGPGETWTLQYRVNSLSASVSPPRSDFPRSADTNAQLAAPDGQVTGLTGDTTLLLCAIRIVGTGPFVVLTDRTLQSFTALMVPHK